MTGTARMRRPLRALALGLAVLVSACSLPLWSHLNGPGRVLPAPPPPVGDVLVVLALSGGGIRAAALASGTMAELDRLTVPAGNGSNSTILREVDYISSVSGGSFAAAFYALHRDDPQAFASFSRRFLYRNNETKIAWRLFGNPVNWLRVPFTDYDRTDVAARYYSRSLFGDKTFAALPARPRLILNATDLVTGSRFEFTEEYFDCLGSDLRSYPLAYAVAASSAYPVGFAAVTLKNFGQTPERCLTAADRNYLRSQHLNVAGWLRAVRKQRFLERDRIPYVHLADGGIADNLGLGGINERLADGEISDLLNAAQLKGLVVILVNAMPAHDTTLGKRSESPSFVEVVNQSFGLMLEQASTGTSAAFQAALNERQAFDRAQGRDVSFHFLEVRLSDLENAERRERLLAAPTRFSLPEPIVTDLIGAGRDLLYCGGGQRRNTAVLRSIIEAFHKAVGQPGPRASVALAADVAC